MTYTTSKSNLAAQDFDEETVAALKLHPNIEVFKALLSKLEKQDVNPTQQRTGQFSAAVHIRPGELVTRLQALFYQMETRLQERTNDGRTYTFEVKIVTYTTVNPFDAEIGEHVHRDHFLPDPANKNVVLEPPIATERRVFQPTRLGYQRIE